jgi:hypothetical protein
MSGGWRAFLGFMYTLVVALDYMVTVIERAAKHEN